MRLWHVNTYRLENTLNYGMERVWALSYTRGSNNVALGYDEGSILIKVCLLLLLMSSAVISVARWIGCVRKAFVKAVDLVGWVSDWVFEGEGTRG